MKRPPLIVRVQSALAMVADQARRERRPEGGTVCVCGDVADEHGHDPAYPGSSACSVCGCIAFEAGGGT